MHRCVNCPSDPGFEMGGAKKTTISSHPAAIRSCAKIIVTCARVLALIRASHCTGGEVAWTHDCQCGNASKILPLPPISARSSCWQFVAQVALCCPHVAPSEINAIVFKPLFSVQCLWLRLWLLMHVKWFSVFIKQIRRTQESISQADKND